MHGWERRTTYFCRAFPIPAALSAFLGLPLRDVPWFFGIFYKSTLCCSFEPNCTNVVQQSEQSLVLFYVLSFSRSKREIQYKMEPRGECETKKWVVGFLSCSGLIV